MGFCRPKVLQALAKKTRFMQRNRKLTLTSFLTMIFSEPGALSTLSLTSLSGTLGDQDVHISKQALNKRINEQAVSFLREVYLHLYEKQLKLTLTPIALETTVQFNRIRVLDGSTVTMSLDCSLVYPGTVGSGVKFQIEYDLLTGRFLYIDLQAGKAGDCPAGMERLQNLEKNDLFLQDLGYFKFDMLKYIAERDAFYVSRAKSDIRFHTAHPNPRYHPNGDLMEKYAYERLVLEEIVATIKRGEYKEYPLVYMGSNEKVLTRLVVYRMTKEEQLRQDHKIVRRDQTKPGKIKQKSKDLSGISMMVTNLPPSVPAEEVISLYRCRWQIEILFKSWKSDFKIDNYREMKLERWECHLYTELITLLISTLIAYQFRVHFWQTEGLILSEQITMREVGKKIWVLWRARDETVWQSTLERLEKTLRSIGRKNVKKPGPIGWTA